MMRSFLSTGKWTLLALEDDVIFRDLGALDAAIKELPTDWDMLYLGANITDGVSGVQENPPVQYSDHLWRVRRAWTTHAIAYREQAVRDIVATYDPGSGRMFDEWLSSDFIGYRNTFLANPMIAYQRPGKSDLWGCATDYTGAFEKGNQIMSGL
jgi:hypothetical protein